MKPAYKKHKHETKHTGLPIETAPKDGTVILTDTGIVRYWHSWNEQQWIACDPSGEPYSCADNGFSYCLPKLWAPLPTWVLA